MNYSFWCDLLWILNVLDCRSILLTFITFISPTKCILLQLYVNDINVLNIGIKCGTHLTNGDSAISLCPVFFHRRRRLTSAPACTSRRQTSGALLSIARYNGVHPGKIKHDKGNQLPPRLTESENYYNSIKINNKHVCTVIWANL